MSFVLLLVMSPMMFVPESISFTTFETKELCEIALSEAKKEWTVVNRKSKCIDLKQQQKVYEAEEALKRAKRGE